MAYDFWSEDEDEVLTRMWHTHGNGVIARMLGRTRKAVDARGYYLELGPKGFSGGYRSADADRRVIAQRKKRERIALLKPRGGNFDSRGALNRLLELWAS